MSFEADAVKYVKRGWAIVPITWKLPNGKCCCTEYDRSTSVCKSVAKHAYAPLAPHGANSASTSLKTVRQWYRDYPKLNVGIAVAESGLVVVDIDPRNGGNRTMREVLDRHGKLPETLRERTGGGGWHIFFSADGRRYASKLGAGVDLKYNGLLVVSPSIHESGRAYRWQNPGTEIAPSPGWLALASAAAGGKAFASIEEVLHGASEGSRDEDLFHLALTLARAGVSRAMVEGAVLSGAARAQPPFAERDALRKVQSAFDRLGQLDSNPFAYTDIGNAERMVALHSNDVRVTTGYGPLLWDGKRWTSASVGELGRRAVSTIKLMKLTEDKPDDKEFMRHFQRSQGRSAVKNMLEFFKEDKLIETDFTIFNAKPYLFNCANGTLDLSEAKPKFRPHSRLDYLTFISPADYNPDARCPQIDAWLNDILPEELVKVIYEIVGLLLIDEWKYKSSFFLVGPSNSGKSTLLRLIEALLTRDLFSSVPLQKLSTSTFAAADLLGKRANICADLPSTYIEDSSTFKQLTGGDMVSAERKYGQPFAFRNQARLLFSANDMPKARDKSTAYTGRLMIIPFTKVISKEEQAADPTFEDRLQSELSGFLNRAVQGLARLRKQDGFTRSEIIERARSDYRAVLLPAVGWLKENVVTDPNGVVPKSTLYDSFKKEHSKVAITRQEFNKNVREVFGEDVRDRYVNGKPIRMLGLEVFRGIRLTKLN